MPTKLQATIAAERVRDVFGRPGTPVYAASVILSAIVVQACLVVMPWSAHSGPLVWAAIMILLEASVAAGVHAFHRRPRDDAEVRRWGRWKVAHEMVHGFGWSLCIPLVYDASGNLSLIVAMTTLVGLVSAAAPGYSVHLPTATGFITFALLPGSAYLLLFSNAGSAKAASVTLAITYVLSMANGLRWSAFYREGIQLRIDLADGIEERRRLAEAADEGRRLAEAATADRTRFYGAASHDLRQPVHALGLYASLLRQDPPRGERRDLIDNIAACVAGLEQMFDTILDLSRPAGMAAAQTPVAIHEMVAATLLKFRPDAERRGLRVEVSGGQAWAHGDAAAIERILGNLVSNAVRYTETGRIAVRTRRIGARVTVSVADTGPGLDAGERERIFDPFYRAPQAREGADRAGVGLGLATVRELCRSQGFAIDVRSQVGVGSLFRIAMPAAGSSAPVPAEASVDPILPGLRVLMVEDDTHVADAASRLLTSWGASVRTCRDGDRAVAIIDEQPHVAWHVLLDYRLDGSANGLEIADTLRARFGRQLRLTLITGEADPDLFAAAAERGIPVLRKPLKPIRLRALLTGRG